MSNGTEYYVAPRQPGVRPADPPDYDGITFVYVFTVVIDPWVMPPQLEDVTLVVDNAQGFLSGMSIIIEAAGAFEVVSTDVLNRMTVKNLGYFQNAAPGTTIAPGKITTTSLPGPQGDLGPQGPAATVAVGSTTTSPPGQNAQVTNSGSSSAAVLNFTIPRGIDGPQGPQGVPGSSYNSVTTAAFTAANAPTVQNLFLQSTTGLFNGVILNINPIGYYQVTGVISGTEVNVVNLGLSTNAAAGTVSPSGSPVLGTGPQGPQGAQGVAGTNGATGAQGPPGTNGTNGAPGAAATIVVNSTTTGAPGTNASVTNSGSSSAASLDFVIPSGVTGPSGPQGVQGTQGTTGAQGVPGAAATVAAGTTSTGAPGSNASVTNSGTPNAAVFNFTIPRGDVGAQGAQGVPGPNPTQPMILAGTTTPDSNAPSAIVVPSFVHHPDAAWTPMGAFDDHFDGTTLNAKWLTADTGMTQPVLAVAGSRVSIGGYSPGVDSTVYLKVIYQPLPNANSFTITVRADAGLAAYTSGSTTSYGALSILLYNYSNNLGVENSFFAYNSAGAYMFPWIIYGGAGLNTALNQFFINSVPRYLKLVFSASDYSTAIYFSNDGFTYQYHVYASGAQSGFSASILPTHLYLRIKTYNAGRALAHFDWVKFTNP